jgi:ATP-dependent DNA ligase
MDDRHAWRPQTASRKAKAAQIRDPIVEPWWRGTRVLAAYVEGEDWRAFGSLDLIDAQGNDASSLAPRTCDQLRRSIRATEAVLDGVLTIETIAGEMLELPEPGFVALDLLSIDRQSLLEVPLLERKRLLEGTLEQGNLVRLSPWARPPIRGWFDSWHRAGFRGAVMKAANSRYTPGAETTEWAILDKPPR